MSLQWLPIVKRKGEKGRRQQWRHLSLIAIPAVLLQLTQLCALSQTRWAEVGRAFSQLCRIHFFKNYLVIPTNRYMCRLPAVNNLQAPTYISYCSTPVNNLQLKKESILPFCGVGRGVVRIFFISKPAVYPSLHRCYKTAQKIGSKLLLQLTRSCILSAFWQKSQNNQCTAGLIPAIGPRYENMEVPFILQLTRSYIVHRFWQKFSKENYQIAGVKPAICRHFVNNETVFVLQLTRDSTSSTNFTSNF